MTGASMSEMAQAGPARRSPSARSWRPGSLMSGAPEPSTRRPSPAPTAVSWPLPLSTTLYRWRCTDGKARRLPRKPAARPSARWMPEPARRVIFPAARAAG